MANKTSNDFLGKIYEVNIEETNSIENVSKYNIQKLILPLSAV